MEKGTPPTGNKTSWSKQSAVLLINIVKDVEQRILKKELLVGKENEKTKWDYVATFLHEASPGDASKTPNNCQYKFWELNRHFKFLLKETAGKKVAEEKEGPIFSALKSYYGNSPPIKKRKRPQSRIELFKDSGKEPQGQMDIQTPPLQLVRFPVPHNDAICESEDDSGESLQNLAHGESVGQLVVTSQPGQHSEDDSAGSPLHNATGNAAEQPRTSHAARGRPPKSNRKASVLGSSDLQEEEKEEKRSSHRLKEMVDKMTRLTSYMQWKQTGVGEDWRCILTDRIERRQKRSLRKQTNNVNQADEANEAQVADEIEAALREDILSFWNELDKKRPSEQECHKYFLKKYAGEVSY